MTYSNAIGPNSSQWLPTTTVNLSEVLQFHFSVDLFLIFMIFLFRFVLFPLLPFYLLFFLSSSLVSLDGVLRSVEHFPQTFVAEEELTNCIVAYSPRSR